MSRSAVQVEGTAGATAGALQVHGEAGSLVALQQVGLGRAAGGRKTRYSILSYERTLALILCGMEAIVEFHRGPTTPTQLNSLSGCSVGKMKEAQNSSR